jgi:dTDP-4-amino-4,6-dideoxy-D-glucose acyltransferase
VLDPSRVALASHIRIDADALLSPSSGRIEIGRYSHIGTGAQLFGAETIRFEDFASISPRVSLFSITDDVGKPALFGPAVPDEVRDLRKGPIVLERYSGVGCGAIVLPGVTVGRGAAVGALSMVLKDVPPGAIVAGVPARQVGSRDLDAVEELAQKVLDSS